MTDLSCIHKHTKFQPTDEQWKCPNCGTGYNSDRFSDPYFYIDESINPECDLLHPGDVVVCTKCQKSWNGSTISRLLLKKNELVSCPTCKGSGNTKSDSPALVELQQMKERIEMLDTTVEHFRDLLDSALDCLGRTEENCGCPTHQAGCLHKKVIEGIQEALK